MDNQEQVSKEFLGEYKLLTQKYGMQFAASPKWVQRDDGTFSLVINMFLVEVPVEK